jgi:hypothetical protein
MSLAGSPASIAKFAAGLRRLSRVVAQKVTEAAAPALTELGLATFDASEDAYGDSWAIGADGRRVTLDRTGALKSTLRYVAIGTRLRVALGVPYAKYQIGKRPVFPAQGGELPVAYSEALAKSSADAVREELAR